MILRTMFLAAALLILAPARGLAITAAQWQSDLQYLVSHLRSTHPNLFFHVSAQDLNAAVNDLNQRIPDRKSTRLNSSHLGISYAVFCLKKKHSRTLEGRDRDLVFFF